MQALIVDDARVMRMILRNLLKSIGFAVAEAENGRAALEQLGRMDRPDVVFVDCFMPEMDGFEFSAPSAPTTAMPTCRC